MDDAALARPSRDRWVGRRGDLLTQDPRLRDVLRLAQRGARTELTILITGETGTGKELLARFIHANSARANRPFVAYNCSAVPATLVESEFFGYVRGAFTGAARDRRGVFDLAHGGTMFLDEVSDLHPEAQPKLLRVIEDGEVWRLGDERPHQVDVRLISATNRELKTMVAAGRFRDDLFFRLAVVVLPIPPLRDRRGDIPLLARHFLEAYGKECGRPDVRISSGALKLLEGYEFSGNVRELQHLIARAVILLEAGDTLYPEHFPEARGDRRAESFQERVREFKRGLILDAVNSAGSMRRAAAQLGMSPRNLRKLCRRFAVVGVRGPKVPPVYQNDPPQTA